ncbi:MAG: M20/M25/M40 family metallo-hydrolase [Actinomycetota bacterium]|nr:M20/M25/M40 family metallo-hydrolase [Actinomycetota bacterium]
MATLSVRDEATELLQELIRADTVNPPGNETRAAELLRTYLGDNGVHSELLAKVPERANLVARIPGTGGGPRLILLSHTDTVLADPAEWTLDPWSGELRGGEIWGRGALDMKGQVAASAVAIASLARDGFEPSGDLIFAACADEEVGAGFGLQWLVEAHGDSVRAEYCINEGGGDRLVLGGRVFYGCATAEKMSSPFRLTVHGRSGHASRPRLSDNALVKAAPLVERLAAYRPAAEIGTELAVFLDAVCGYVPQPEEAVRAARGVHPLAGDIVEPLLGTTLSPTMIEASRKRNVVPNRCQITVDCRILPGHTQAEVEAEVRDLLGDVEFDFTWIEGHGGTRSAVETPLWSVVESFVAAEEPQATVVPLLLAGFTDSHWLRQAFGTVAYGFFPMRKMEAEVASRLVHSADERIEVEDLELGVRFLRHAALEVGSLPSAR